MLDTLESVGVQTLAVFRRAGWNSIGHLFVGDAYGQRCQDAIAALKAENPHMPMAYWSALTRRCASIIYRVRSAEASPYVPQEYMCGLTLDWFHDPVVSKYGITYERSAITELVERTGNDDSRRPLLLSELYPNHQMRAATEFFRLRHLRFSVPVYLA